MTSRQIAWVLAAFMLVPVVMGLRRTWLDNGASLFWEMTRPAVTGGSGLTATMNRSGELVCSDGDGARQWLPRLDGMCYEADRSSLAYEEAPSKVKAHQEPAGPLKAIGSQIDATTRKIERATERMTITRVTGDDSPGTNEEIKMTPADTVTGPLSWWATPASTIQWNAGPIHETARVDGTLHAFILYDENHEEVVRLEEGTRGDPIHERFAAAMVGVAYMAVVKDWREALPKKPCSETDRTGHPTWPCEIAPK